MDNSGFLSAKANAFSIAHLIDGSHHCVDLEAMRQSGSYASSWSSQQFQQEMEGKYIYIMN
jgi:hypothetical protein